MTSGVRNGTHMSIVARCVQNAPSSVYGMKFGEIRRQDTYPRAIAVIGVLPFYLPLSLLRMRALRPSEIIGVRREIEVLSQAVGSSANFRWRIQGRLPLEIILIVRRHWRVGPGPAASLR